jgi:hypothetical protein
MAGATEVERLTHCLRHGSITDANAKTGTAGAQARSAHQTESMITDLYGVPAQQRIENLHQRRVNLKKAKAERAKLPLKKRKMKEPYLRKQRKKKR